MEPNTPDIPPGEINAIWPPPPTNQAALPQGGSYPFKTVMRYVQGSVPNFRLGTVSLYPEGVVIQGKSIVRYEIQIPILIACLFLRFGFLIAYAVLEYGFRRDDRVSANWADVRSLVLMPQKQLVCLVYEAPNYKGLIKTFSLAFKLDPTLYESFVANVRQSIPDRVEEGKLRAWTSPPGWIFLGGLLLGLLILLVVFLTTGHGAATP